MPASRATLALIDARGLSHNKAHSPNALKRKAHPLERVHVAESTPEDQSLVEQASLPAEQVKPDNDQETVTVMAPKRKSRRVMTEAQLSGSA